MKISNFAIRYFDILLPNCMIFILYGYLFIYLFFFFIWRVIGYFKDNRLQRYIEFPGCIDVINVPNRVGSSRKHP